MTAPVPVPETRTAEPPWLARTRLRAHRRALWLRRLWSQDGETPGIAITPGEVDRVLHDPAEMSSEERHFFAEDPAARKLSLAIDEADAAAERDPRWCTLAEAFSLSARECDLLALACAVALDPAFGRVCGYLHDDPSACYATRLLAAALFGSNAPWPASPALERWRLATVPRNAGHPAAHNAPWLADPYIAAWLHGDRAPDPVIAGAIETIRAANVRPLESLDAETHAAIRSFISAVRPPVEIELSAPEGSGKRTLAAQVCADLGADLMAVDAAALVAGDPAPAQVIERAVHALRAARLERAVPYWHRSALLDDRVRRAIEGACGLAFFGGESPARARPTALAAQGWFAMRPLPQSARVHLWKRFTAEPMPEAIRAWSLRPAEIEAASQVAPAGPAAVLDACRRMLHSEEADLFTVLPCPYAWNDIVLTHGVRRQLEELASQARLTAPVLEEWGFERLCRMGRGLNVLFAGPSGTGKTMAAQVVARALGRELYRVDLAGVVNKYIGETEKRLRRVFDACERSAVVLFFDEADALFGQRTQVKDAHDRYANIQIDYLLQRMEQFDGVAILATNRKNDLDQAFLRRLRFIVDFLPPGVPERLALWRIALAPQSPSGEELLADIDWDWLAENLVMTGADIKATALAAAFLARAEGSRIRMDQLLHASRREMHKQGASWRAGDWSARANA